MAKMKPSVSEELAKITFAANLDLIRENNKNPKKTYKMAVNKVSDIPQD